MCDGRQQLHNWLSVKLAASACLIPEAARNRQPTSHLPLSRYILRLGYPAQQKRDLAYVHCFRWTPSENVWYTTYHDTVISSVSGQGTTNERPSCVRMWSAVETGRPPPIWKKHTMPGRLPLNAALAHDGRSMTTRSSDF